MRGFYPLVAVTLGFEIIVAAAFFGSTPMVVLGLLAIVCGTADFLRLLGISVPKACAYVLDCLLLAAVYLWLCLFKPSASDAPHELD